ncbi:hypothetical protein CAPN001_06540 [Capnocytophaga stomatis]|nr:hypothetical protein CAPN002_04300 [Capnocytophaga stomatis]GIJ96085.1 hypothetical protein CAPN001_06540 [Capnocytophaga stomatis]GIM50358.1 hypothetical protein CAPN003_18100 [Capnocytophaga stomatis]
MTIKNPNVIESNKIMSCVWLPVFLILPHFNTNNAIGKRIKIVIILAQKEYLTLKLSIAIF